MSSLFEIIPGINSDDPQFVQAELDAFAELDPVPKHIQLDVTDGEFAPELTIEPNLLREMNRHDLTIDVHLMTLEPIDYVHELHGVSGIGTVIAQIERMSSEAEFVEEVLANHLSAGLALELYTPFEEIDQQVLSQLQVVQVLAGPTGPSGQPFNEFVLEKIREIAQYKQELQLEFQILVDIGMNPQTIPLVKSAGANGAVVVSYLQKPDRQATWQQLQEAK
jgi:ribulose-phosphate 3-epimerase